MSDLHFSDQDPTPEPVVDRTSSRMSEPDLSGILLDQTRDGIAGYLNARIYVADDVEPNELAAAANLGARLAFEALSLDLPLGISMCDFREADSTVAIVIGEAALPWTGGRGGIWEGSAGDRRVLAISSAEETNQWACSLAVSNYDNLTALPPDANAPPGSRRSDPSGSLADLFTTCGLLGQSPDSIFEDSIETGLWLGPNVHSPAVIDLAARLALETTGLTLPLAFASNAEPGSANPILIGASHPRLQLFTDANASGSGLQPGEGQLWLTYSASGTGMALVIRGGDDAGETAALRYAAAELPFVSGFGEGNVKLGDIESDLARFLSVRSSEGQFAAGVSRARRMMAARLPAIQNNRSEVRISVEGANEDLRRYAATCSLPAAVTLSDARAYETVFDEALTLPWEVDTARARIRETVLTSVGDGSTVEVDLRISEPQDIRQSLTEEFEKQLLAQGAHPDKTRVRVLPAFKQGYAWIDEILKPQLANAVSIIIRVRRVPDSAPGLLDSNARWLQELYPIDEILARDLGLGTSAIGFELTEDGPTYQVIGKDKTGTVCVDETFEPTFAIQPLFDAFPDYACAQVSTGWIRASIDSAIQIDERLPTDPERVWSAIQQRGLGKLGDYLRALYEGPPPEGAAPHFGAFEIEVELSEPDVRIGIDEERISTAEALHEDIYFNSLLFIEILSKYYFGEALTYPGRIIPRVRPSETGSGPRIRLRLTGKGEPGPAARVTDATGAKGRQGDSDIWRSALVPVDTPRPRITRATVRLGSGDVTLGVIVPSETDAGAPRNVEVGDMLTTLGEMRSQGLVARTLNYEGVGRIDITWTDGIKRSEVSLAQAGNRAFRRPRLSPGSDPSPSRRLTEALDSKETAAHIARLGTLPGVRPFYAGESFLGTTIWALEVTRPLEGTYTSRARMAVTRPVLFLTGRQHGNEVSSTSHILQLVEWLSSTGEGKRLLEQVNLIVQPMTNPDGADLACELSQATPDFMLHAGYTGCLGVDVTRDQWARDPLYPESRIRRELWELWRPDVVLDPHGYPSHEWVQLFGGHAAWFRSRTEIRRDWWIPRGAFIPHFEVVRDPDFPHHESTACAIRDRIALALADSMADVNERMYARYRKYVGACCMPLPWETHAGLLVYPSGSVNPGKTADSTTGRQSFMTRHPEVTVFQSAIELPDETARGAWLERLTRAGFEASLACVRFLTECEYKITRSRLENEGRTTFRIERPRPLRPPGAST